MWLKSFLPSADDDAGAEDFGVPFAFFASDFPASARQLLFFILSFHHLGEQLNEEKALFSLMRLREACIREPLKPATLQAFLNLWDRIMMQSSATEIAEKELERLFYQSIQHAQHSELQHELRFYRESPSHMQGQPALRRRIDRMIYQKDVEESKRQAEKALTEELTLKPSARKGAPAKEQKGKKATTHDAESNASGEGSRTKEQLAHSNRQLQAMAKQVRALGATPVFVKRPNQGNDSDT